MKLIHPWSFNLAGQMHYPHDGFTLSCRQRANHPHNPIADWPHIIIGKEQHLSLGRRESGIVGIAFPNPRLMHIVYRRSATTRAPRNHLGSISRSIVHHQNFNRPTFRNGQGTDRSQRGSKAFRSIPRANDD